eukprot:6668780-Pyramimonas_sp.AAC.1
MAEYRGMSVAQRDDFHQLHDRLENEGAADQHLDDGEADLLDIVREARCSRSGSRVEDYGVEQLSRRLLPFDFGDEFWPVDAAKFQAHLEVLAQKFGIEEWRGGLGLLGEKRR